MAKLFTLEIRCEKTVSRYNTKNEKVAEEQIIYDHVVEALTESAIARYKLCYPGSQFTVKPYLGDIYYEPRNTTAVGSRFTRRRQTNYADVTRDLCEELKNL